MKKSRKPEKKKTPVKAASKTETPKKKSSLRENIEAILVAVLLALFIRGFVVQAFKIPSGSMENTLLIGDHILVNKFIYGVKVPFTGITVIPGKKPQRGDIVVFRYPKNPKKDYIKRVVGVAGDTIEIRNKKVYVNGVLENNPFAIYSEPNIIRYERDNMRPTVVPPNSLFVMGDNRDNSQDSRFWGFVKLGALRGKAFMIYWSWDKYKFDLFNGRLGARWSRIGDILK